MAILTTWKILVMLFPMGNKCPLESSHQVILVVGDFNPLPTLHTKNILMKGSAYLQHS